MSKLCCTLLLINVVGLASSIPVIQFGNKTQRGGLVFTDRQIQIAKERTAKLLAESRNGTSVITASTCEADMHSKITPCRQYCNEWCWAATGTMLWNYYSGETSCERECSFVSTFMAGQGSQVCCPAVGRGCQGTERDQQSQCNHGVSKWDQLAQMMHDLTGKQFVGEANVGPMDQATLDSTLAAGNPIEVGFSFQGGGHACFIGGCTGGKYWVHDPWSFDGLPENNFKLYTYEELLNFSLGGKPCTWTAHLYSTDKGPAPPNPPSPTPPSPPTPPTPPPPTPTPPTPPTPTPPTPPTPTPPTPPSPPPSFICDSSKGCNVCSACCKPYIKDPTDCQMCVQSECPAVCVPAKGCTVCAACCKSYLNNQTDCDECSKAECGK